MSEVTSKRQPNGHHHLFNGDTQVGVVWRRGRHGFTMNLRGIYWRGGEPNCTGGETCKRVKRLKDAVALAETTLQQLDRSVA